MSFLFFVKPLWINIADWPSCEDLSDQAGQEDIVA